MKKQLLSIIAFSTLSLGAAAQNVTIPDANFKAYLVGESAINTNGDTEIQVSEATSFAGEIDCNNQNISDLTGIEFFTSLTELLCYDNQLTKLDLSLNTSLTDLNCQSNSIDTLDLSNNPNLLGVNCQSNSLTSLNLANGFNSSVYNVNLWYVNTTGNSSLTCIQHDVGFDPNTTNSWSKNFGVNWSTNCNPPVCTVTIPDANFKSYLVGNTQINTNGNTEIECTEASAFTGILDCNNMNISDLTGIEAFTQIVYLFCNNNQLTSIDLSANTSLIYLYCQYNQLTAIDLSANSSLIEVNLESNQLTSLNLANNSAIEYLYFPLNYISSINLSSNTSLVELKCYNNDLTALDLSNNSGLTDVQCFNNNLTSLTLPSNSGALESLECNNNQLTSLDIYAATSLENLNCKNNQLVSLDVSANSYLNFLLCLNNQISSLDISNNGQLDIVNCSNNSLTALNIANGYNTDIYSMNASGNSNLFCVQHDNNFDPTSVNGWSKDAAASWSTNCTISVSSITVQGQGGVSSITTLGGGLQMEATVLPVNADDNSVTWSVTNGTGTATISANGLLTATTDGNVIVTANANDGSGISGSAIIILSNQTSVGLNDLQTHAIKAYPNPTNGLVSFSTKEPIQTIEVYNLSGQKLLNFNNENTIDISSLPSGIYTAKIFVGSSNPRIERLIKH